MRDINYPDWICYTCGETHGRRGVNPHASWHPDKCGVCGESVYVTEPRDFGHLNDGWQKAVEARTRLG
jgi:hypothetical protein